MDRQDNDFEDLLQQFNLREPRPLRDLAPRRSTPKRRWLAVAAAITIVVLIPTAIYRDAVFHRETRAIVETGDGLLKPGQRIEYGEVVHSSGSAGAVFTLIDGSRVEMRAESEISLKPASDGVQIHLNKGSVIVTAAKQHAGHLYVQTRDCTVSVVGTVFLVSTDDVGSRVAVIQGEVHVQNGSTLKALLPGEQMATAPSMKVLPVVEEISWSRYAVAHMELLKQSVNNPIAELQESPLHALPEAPPEPMNSVAAAPKPAATPPVQPEIAITPLPPSPPIDDAYSVARDRAIAEKAKGDLKQAIEDFGKAIVLKPHSADAYKNRATAEYAQGDLKGAIADFSKAASIKPDDAEAYSRRAAAEYAKGNFNGSRSDEVKAANLKQGTPEVSPASCGTAQADFVRGQAYRAYTGCPLPRNQVGLMNLKGTLVMAVDGKSTYNVPSQAKEKNDFYVDSSESLELLPGRHTIRFLLGEMAVGRLIRPSSVSGTYLEKDVDIEAGKTYTAFATVWNSPAATTTIEITDPNKTPAAYLQSYEASLKGGDSAAALSALESYVLLFPKEPDYKAVVDKADKLRGSLIKAQIDAYLNPNNDHPTSPGCAISSGPALQVKASAPANRQASPDLATVLSRATRYVEAYESQLGSLIGEEVYIQNEAPLKQLPFVTDGVRAGGPRPYTRPYSHQKTESDFAILRVGQDFVGLRAVKCLDGVSAPRTGDDFQKIIHDSPSTIQKAIDKISRESARYNVGDVYRTNNLPTFALRVLRTQTAGRFEFKKSGEANIGGIRTWTIGFRELQGPTIIRDLANHDEFSNGTLWIEPKTGHVLKSELNVAGRQRQVSFSSQTVVSYRNDPKLGMLVPVTMDEHYNTGGHRVLDCRADYFNFRRMVP